MRTPFDRVEHASKASAALEAAFGGMLDGAEPTRGGSVASVASAKRS